MDGKRIYHIVTENVIKTNKYKLSHLCNQLVLVKKIIRVIYSDFFVTILFVMSERAFCSNSRPAEIVPTLYKPLRL